MDRKEATAEIARKVEEAYKALGEASKLADEFGLSFSFGPSYGMGGTYYGQTKPEDAHDGWESSSSEEGWISSSSQC